LFSICSHWQFDAPRVAIDVGTAKGEQVERYELELHDREDDLDWTSTLLAAGIEPTFRDMSHLPISEQAALLTSEEQVASDLARAAGIPQEHDLFSHGDARGLSSEMQCRLIDTVNRLPVPGDAFARMMLITDLVPEELKVEGPTCAYTAIECAEVQGLTDRGAPLSLLARSIALRRWRADHDPDGKGDKNAQIAAAAGAPIILVDGGPAFDGSSLNDLIAFVNDLPW
jgi:hypothetical protein